jgi:malate synthase
MTVEVAPHPEGRTAEVLDDGALAFVAALHERFEPRRQELLAARRERRQRLAAGETLDFLTQTREIREGDWQVAPVPADLQDRRVEITGPVDRKMIINALNSGARGFMADFEDSLSPTWSNIAEGQANLTDAIERTIGFTGPDGREYRLGEQTATLLVRPRGWHLPEKHVRIGGSAVSGALVDAGLFLYHNARRLLDKGSGPYFYLPKMESHLEARLWNEVFCFAQDELGLDRGTIKATVLIETLPAAFEMEEILYELRDHSAGLNAGRWDYMFSTIKTFRERPEFVLPDRNEVKMTVPFLRAYTELLVRTCHRRGAHAMGGMAALIPSRKDPEANERAIEAVAADKRREAGDGFDGTWVAHPDVVATAMAEFDRVLGDRPNQVDRQREDVQVGAAELLDVASTPGDITEAGLRNDVNVGIQYISSWLRGNGAAGIYGLMEDAATAEIARSQVWQWIRHERTLADGPQVTPDLVRRLATEELERIREEIGDDAWFETEGRPRESRELFERVALGDELEEFLTMPAYEKLA